MQNANNFEFNLIVVPDKVTGQFTAFFAQFPQAIAVGATETEVQVNLINTVGVMLRDKRNETVSGLVEKYEYKEKHFNVELSSVE